MYLRNTPFGQLVIEVEGREMEGFNLMWLPSRLTNHGTALLLPERPRNDTATRSSAKGSSGVN